MSKMQREKGKRGEREAAEFFARLFGGDVRRSSGQSRKGSDAPDLVGLPHGLHVEVKVGIKPNWRGALAQAQAACLEKGLPIVWSRDDRKDAVVVMAADDFAALVLKLKGVASG